LADGRTIAIGDIHGCATALKALLAMLELTTDDTLVMLGDAIDRGPDSRDVLEQLIAVGKLCNFVPILGNHEQMLLDAIDRKRPQREWLIHGGNETLDSYGSVSTLADIPQEHVDFICTWIDYFETDGYFFAHGNYLPKKKLNKQPWEEMRWRSLKNFLPAQHVSKKTAILGHTANKQGEIVNHGHLVCIDTFCHGGGWLTALEPKTVMVWQANELCESRQSQLDSDEVSSS